MPTTDQIRSRLDHPVIDSDGHLVEFIPAVRDHVREIAGAELAERVESLVDSTPIVRRMSVAERQTAGIPRITWWGFPARNTLDRATAHLPALLYDRLDEIGLDLSVVYPTMGLGAVGHADDEIRRALTRAFNLYAAEACEGLTDRILPVALIPMHTPQEAIQELDFCVEQLGYRVAVVAGSVRRTVPGLPQSGSCYWLDDLGPDSPYDYEPVWQRCVELGIAPSFHSSAMGQGTRTSPTSYLYNHVGSFAAAQEGICRALILGGVPRRFPSLRLSFLEGGMGWACSLYADLVSHFAKRNREHIVHYDPRQIDQAQLSELFKRHGSARFQRLLDEVERGSHFMSHPDEPDTNEFSRSGLESVEDIRDVFEQQIFVGCEADDPMNATAFDPRIHPLGSRLNAIIGSDVGHWDVPDVSQVLPEAWELVEDGVITEADFRAFVFGNPVRLWAEANPCFFEGTVVEDAAARELA